jgi:hypothetical protein
LQPSDCIYFSGVAYHAASVVTTATKKTVFFSASFATTLLQTKKSIIVPVIGLIAFTKQQAYIDASLVPIAGDPADPKYEETIPDLSHWCQY